MIRSPMAPTSTTIDTRLEDFELSNFRIHRLENLLSILTTVEKNENYLNCVVWVVRTV